MLTLPRQPHQSCPSVLSQALAADVNLAVWERQLPAAVTAFANSVLLTAQPLADSRIIDVQDEHPPELSDFAKGFEGLDGYHAFSNDVAWLIHAYACLTGAQRVGLRIRKLGKAMCPRYHVDWVSLRLITTYAGTGSQWLEEGMMPRDALGDPNAQPTSAPRQLLAGNVALFKGERWEGNEGRGIIHRSPPVEDGQGRLIMTLDWLK